MRKWRFQESFFRGWCSVSFGEDGGEIRAEELQSAGRQRQTVVPEQGGRIGRYRNSVARLAVRVLFGAVFL